MNCQEFRSKWEHSIDDAIYEHIETCEDCLNWIEKSTSVLEEAMFLKEYPKPSAMLEDRIMQAIYQADGKIVPLSATVLPAAGDHPTEKPNKRRFFVPTWVAAAGVVVAVGLIGGPLLTGQQTEKFAEVASSPSSMDNQVGDVTNDSNKSASGAASKASVADSGAASADQSAGNQNLQAASPEGGFGPSALQAPNGGAESAETAARSKKNAPLMDAQNAQQKTSATAPKTDAAANQAKAHTPLPARSSAVLKSPPPTFANKQAMKQPAAAVEAQVPSVADNGLSTATEKEDSTRNTTAAFIGPQLHASKNEAQSIAANEASDVTAKQMLGPENPITLSTFNDIDSAVQASDLPVPTLGKVPADYSLNMLTVQYESQTSKHVSNIQTIYQQTNSSKRITIDMTLQQGKRNLSVPGEFSSTQVFQIDDEQAIGVTYKDNAEPSATKSAVHYQATKDSHSFYIVVTADGMSLHDLMDLTKQINWRQ